MTYDEQIAVIIAAKKGKTIQFKPKADNHAEWQDDNMLSQFDFNTNYYRVKPENKYRPFKNADEAFSEAKKHGFWCKAGDDYDQIAEITNKGFVFAIDIAYGKRETPFEECLNLVWADTNEPCGILEE